MRLKGQHKRKIMPLIQELMNKGIKVYTDIAPANISIVLDGKTENPLAFHGKRVLVYWANMWGPKGLFEELYKPVLEEYYDDMLDATNLTMSETLERLINYEA